MAVSPRDSMISSYMGLPTKDDRTPLPKFQLSLVYYASAIETIAGESIEPFLIKFVQNTGVTGGDERKAGYYAGTIGSAFSIAEALTVFQWGRVSDRRGRRPILLLGTLGISMTVLWFGLSSTYWSLVLSRCLQGTFNAAIGVGKSIIAELSDSSNISEAYTILAIAWTMGAAVGGYIGGLFAEPATRWPSVFGDSPFFIHHPYALPCIVVSIISFTSAFLALIWLKETHPRIVGRADTEMRILEDDESTSSASTETTPLIDSDSEDSGPSRRPASSRADPPPLKDLLIPTVLLPVITYAFQAFSSQTQSTLPGLVYATSVENGGLGLSPYQIGQILTTFGIVQFIFQIFFVPPLIRWCGVKQSQVIGHTGYLLNLLLYPFLNHFARTTGGMNFMVWSVLVLQYLCRLTNIFAYASINVIIASSAPFSSALGATMGLGQAVSAVARSIAPSLSSSLFAFSQERQILGGSFVYLILASISFIGLRLAFRLPNHIET